MGGGDIGRRRRGLLALIRRAADRGRVHRGRRALEAVAVGEAAARRGRRALTLIAAGRAHRGDDRRVHPPIRRPGIAAAAGQLEPLRADRESGSQPPRRHCASSRTWTWPAHLPPRPGADAGDRRCRMLGASARFILGRRDRIAARHRGSRNAPQSPNTPRLSRAARGAARRASSNRKGNRRGIGPHCRKPSPPEAGAPDISDRNTPARPLDQTTRKSLALMLRPVPTTAKTVPAAAPSPSGSNASSPVLRIS